jgi:uncharacterized protein
MAESMTPAAETNVRRWLAIAGIAGPSAGLAYVATVAIGGAIVPGYSHLADSVSSLTSPGGAFRTELALGFVLYNVAVVALGAAILGVAGGRRTLRIAGILLVACGVAGVLMLEPFPQDAAGQPLTTAGIVHIVLALASALTLVTATFLSAVGFRRDSTFAVLRWPSVAAGIAILVTGGVGSAALSGGSPYFGAIERLTQLSFVSWFTAIGVTALLALRRRRASEPLPRLSESPTDVDLVHAVSRAFAQSADVDHSAVRIAAEGGRVRLAGRVATHAQRLAAATLAARIPGATEVDNGLTVADVDFDVLARTDADTTGAVARAIAESTVAVSDLRVDVRNRVVTVEGRVRSERDRAALRHAIQDVPGVHFVDIRLAVEESSAEADGAEELEPAACLLLLADGGVGRLAVQEETGVDMFPVNYLLHDGKVYFRSGPGVKMIRLTRSPDVAFEADGYDSVWSWSVVVKGTAARLDNDDEIASSGVADLRTAHTGDKLNYVRITPRQISGRRFRHAR